MKVGIYGGSFDPIHFGHLILAREALESLELDEVRFIPAAVSPHKRGAPPAPAATRAEMVRAAIAGEPGFAFDDCEMRRDGVSFTIDTVRDLLRRLPGAELFYFIGDDNLAELDTWKEIDALRANVRFVVFSRLDPDPASPFPVIRRVIDISSTEVRNRVAAGRSIRYLVPEIVREITEAHRLYRND